MIVQVELWALITFFIGLAVTFIGGVSSFAKAMATQADKRLDEKFNAQDKARETGAKALRETLNHHMEQEQKTSAQIQSLERDFLQWRAELPVLYVRREDYIRNQTVIEAKIDAVALKIENLQLRNLAHA